MKHIWLCGFAAVVALALLAPSGAFAQATGRLTGQVLDPSGATVEGATVSLFLADGKEPVLTALTTSDGIYSLIGVRPEFYNVVIEKEGFEKQVIEGVKVDAGRETPQPPVSLKLGARTQQVVTRAELPGVQMSNAEVSTTLTNDQIRRLPVLNRDPLSLIRTQAGVNYTSNGVVVNGLRVAYGNATLDGINVQDNRLREQALSVLPNRLLLDQVREMTIVTANASPAVGLGGAQIAFLTPSGGNNLHGSAYYYHTNDSLAANKWYDNSLALGGARILRHQAGGTLSGAVVKDKLFFYGNYEAFRGRDRSATLRGVLTPSARQGIYTASNGAQLNVLQVTGLTMDPAIKSWLDTTPVPNYFRKNSKGAYIQGDGLNFAGYTYGARDQRRLDNVIGKLDYVHSPKNVFAVDFLYNRVDSDSPLASDDLSFIPNKYEQTEPKFLSGSWRWTPAATLTNELRAGFNRINLLLPYRSPFAASRGYRLDFDALGEGWGNWITSPTGLAEGQGRYPNTYAFQDNASYVRGAHTLQFGFQSQWLRTRTFFRDADLPTYFVSEGDTVPDRLLTILYGDVIGQAQTFNVTSRSSGYVKGADLWRSFSYDNYALYLMDRWKLSKKLSLTLGLRWEFYTAPKETNGLMVMPVGLDARNPLATLYNPNAEVDFATGPLFRDDRNNFAPSIGLAYDLTGDGKTALRAAYSLNYLNDGTTLAVDQLRFYNGVLSSTSVAGLSKRLSDKIDPLPVPAFRSRVPVKNNGSVAAIDPNLRLPYVQQWQIGIQREFRGSLFDLRYVGNHAVHAYAVVNYNSVAGRPAINASVPGGAYLLGSSGNSSYNALQFDVSRRFARGLQFQANYTWSKVLTDTGDAGVAQSRLQLTRDFGNLKVERSRARFDLTHALKANAIYDLPLTKSKSGATHAVLGGWSLSGIMILQSGRPFSLLSSSLTPAIALAGRSQLEGQFGLRTNADGPYFVPDSLAGSVLFNVASGTPGTLQRRMFSGPSTFDVDLGLQKLVKLTERQSLEFRLESTNVFNKANWVVFDHTVNATAKTVRGNILQDLYDPRRVQVGLQYRF